jgi:hypothetical protein
MLKHHFSNPSSFIHDAETPPFNTFSFSSDTETPVISSSSSTTIVPIFSVAETPVSHHRPSKQLGPRHNQKSPPQQHFHEQA